ncbi:protein of unknown function [Shewanella benthica]|uniref:Uncharacterized protein n=1 Tax=Shewanella benthica TaxID=43661 RepID=A0A330M310_9GAMM|nr:protein of unknown function [Shewanella benthica]
MFLFYCLSLLISVINLLSVHVFYHLGMGNSIGSNVIIVRLNKLTAIANCQK